METTSVNDPTPIQGPTGQVELKGVVPVIREHIVRTPGTCRGKPRIAGTRIKVEQVVIWHEQMDMRGRDRLQLAPPQTRRRLRGP